MSGELACHLTRTISMCQWWHNLPQFKVLLVQLYKWQGQNLMYQYGCFRKQWYPQIIHVNNVFHYKLSILGDSYFGNTHIWTGGFVHATQQIPCWLFHVCHGHTLLWFNHDHLNAAATYWDFYLNCTKSFGPKTDNIKCLSGTKNKPFLRSIKLKDPKIVVGNLEVLVTSESPPMLGNLLGKCFWYFQQLRVNHHKSPRAPTCSCGINHFMPTICHPPNHSLPLDPRRTGCAMVRQPRYQSRGCST